MLADFPKREKVLNQLVQRLTRAMHVSVTNPAGTNLHFDVRGRRGHGVSGMTRSPGDVTGTPDIEAYIAPVEQKTHGILIVDGSTSVTGVVQQPIKVTVENGFAVSITGGTDASQLRRILRKARSHASFRVGEFGIGLNPLAHIRGAIIEDEGKLGTAHVALGDNTRLGGKNSAPTHVDLVFKNPHIQLDGTTVLKRRRLVI
jgi:leucyl aminopeptidase (aminopeptidase T)